MVATTPLSKQRPYPYDAYIGGVRVMLEPQADGNMVTSKTKTLEATAPIDYTYDSANPYKEKAFEWQALYGGFGQSIAPSGTPRRYSYAIKSDLSIDGLWMKAPNFEDHQETIAAPPPGQTNEVRQLIWAIHLGNLALFAICEQGVYRRQVDGNWVASLTTGTTPALTPGAHPQQAVRFRHRGVAPVDALYVATDSDYLWQYNGTAWNRAAITGGPGLTTDPGQARYIERVGEELWVAGDYWVVNCKDDPMLRASWSGIFRVGDQSAKTTWLRQLADVLYIWKEDGIYTVATDGSDHELFPTLRGNNQLANGKNAAVWIDRVWFTFGDQTFTMDAAANLKADGTEQMLENTSDVHGTWVAGAGHNTWFFYELYYAVNRNTTHLIKHGTWVEENSNQTTPGVAQFAEAHHGSLYDWPKRATCAEIVSGASASYTNDRLYVGFYDGTVQWCILPQHTPNPHEDPICEFTARDSYVYLPTHHSGFRADNKLFHAMTATGPTLTNTEWVEADYRLDIANPFAEWIPISPENPQFTIPAMRKPFTDDPVNKAVYGKLAEFRVKLCSSSGLTPVIEGVVIHESIRPSFSRDFTFSVKAASFLPRHDGLVDRRRGSVILQKVLDECGRVRPVACVMPTGETQILTIIDYRDSAASWGKRRDHEWLIQIQGIQLGTISNEAPATATGLTYDTLEQYTLEELEAGGIW